MQAISKKVSTHHIFIADEKAMNISFPQLKTVLKNTSSDISFINISSNGRYIFQRELDILSRHYPNRLMLYFENFNLAIDEFIENEILQAIINSNICDEMNFIIMTEDDGFYAIKNHLIFLGIEEKNIHLSFFKID